MKGQFLFQTCITLLLSAAVVSAAAEPALANYTQLAKLTASDAAGDDHFGSSVAISGATAIVGAHLNSDAGDNSGSAYLFDVTTGSQIAKLTASDAAAWDEFGICVAISGSTALVGAWGDDHAGDSSGSAYLYDFSDPCSITEIKLTASDAAAWDEFGIRVAISGTTALVGANGDNHAGSSSGSAYLFDVATGSQISKLTASDARDWGLLRLRGPQRHHRPRRGVW